MCVGGGSLDTDVAGGSLLAAWSAERPLQRGRLWNSGLVVRGTEGVGGGEVLGPGPWTPGEGSQVEQRKMLDG